MIRRLISPPTYNGRPNASVLDFAMMVLSRSKNAAALPMPSEDRRRPLPPPACCDRLAKKYARPGLSLRGQGIYRGVGSTRYGALHRDKWRNVDGQMAYLSGLRTT